jgi:carboxyl-terminal processing protease
MVCGIGFLYAATPGAAGVSSLEASSLYQEVVKKLKEESIQPIDEKRLLDSCMEGMVNSVDKNGRYFNEEEYETLYLSSSPVAGIGLFLTQRRHHVFIKSVVDHSPAQKASLQKGDEIVQIDHLLVRDLSFEEVVAELRGAPNTKLKVSVLKANSTKPVEVELTRKQIDLNLITSLMYEGDIAYIKISSFVQESLQELLDDIQYLYDTQNHKMRAMVLDLRDNPGGVINGGLALTGLFLEKDKLLLNVKSRHKEDKKQYKNRLEEFDANDYAAKIDTLSFLKTIPLVVLVNRDSAGSAEIVASVLQEYGRATVMGTPTYGKDTFATLFPLSTKVSAIKFATARWSTPKGKSVWPNGVVPNIELKQSDDASYDNVLQEALLFLSKKK